MHTFKHWLPLGFVTTILCGLVYTAVQQDMRHSADDLPVQIAEDIADRMGRGMPVVNAVGTVDIDLRKSLSPYVIVYNQSGSVLGASAVLDGKTPQVPQGVLDYARANGEHRVTWEPAKGVRQAIAVIPTGGVASAIVVSGHSLREVEARESQLMMEVLAAWVVAMVGSYVLVAAKMKM